VLTQNSSLADFGTKFRIYTEKLSPGFLQSLARFQEMRRERET
jgi:hypothetical protein